MLQIVDITTIMNHCNALSDDSALITQYAEAAEEKILTDTHRTADELIEKGNGDYPYQIKQAVLLLTAHWYRCREAVSSLAQNNVPLAYKSLVMPFRAYKRNWRA